MDKKPFDRAMLKQVVEHYAKKTDRNSKSYHPALAHACIQFLTTPNQPGMYFDNAQANPFYQAAIDKNTDKLALAKSMVEYYELQETLNG